MALEEYRRKRDFTSTPEPAGAAAAHASKEKRSAEAPAGFVVHKHAARALHYDLRLEIGGVYPSWAVPKGPSLDPADKRLAVHVEDHPLEYGKFEGVIPQGEYGGGTVMIWDRGAFLPIGDAADGLAKGSLKFVLEGSKLTGAWALVRMKPRPKETHESWLLIKERDGSVRPRSEFDVLAKEPDSAATGRTMEQIAESGTTWTGGLKGGVNQQDAPKAKGSSREKEPPDRKRSSPEKDPPKDPVPADAPFQLATLVDEAPDGDEWLHEVKYDGYRLRLVLEDGHARALTRNGLDWTGRFAAFAQAVEALPVGSAVLDGEAVVLDADGRSDFGLLQAALSEGDTAAVRFEVFDVLYLDGHDLRAETLERRKALVSSLIAAADEGGPLHAVESYTGRGPAYHAASCELLLEGSMSKRADRPWVGGRTRDWVKVKCSERQEFVVGGWTDPAGTRHGFGALLLGVHEDGKLRYVGRVGTGFTESTLAALAARLGTLASKTSPFAPEPREAGVHWVEPKLVAEIAFREWTRDGVLRQPSFKGLREDKDAADVVRETPATSAASESPALAPEVDDPPASSRGKVTVAGITITNPGRVLGPAGITKADLARYYESVSAWMLPHVLDRPLTIVRCPHGQGTDVGCFYQKHPESRGWPDVFGSVTIQDSGGPAEYFYVRDEAGLIALAQMGTLEIHTWGALAKDPEHPDRIIFDLDPGPGFEFPAVANAARTVRDALEALGLVAFVKTTGGHGLHVVTPIVPNRDHDGVRAFAHAFVDMLAKQRPDLFTSLMRKTERPGRVFVDYLRNSHGATAVSAFSTRARPGANVSVPVAWDELGGLDPATYDIRSVPRRLARLDHDPWVEYEASRRPLTAAMASALGVPSEAAE
jgi:bifunctional non-homologous end joining protein LigD